MVTANCTHVGWFVHALFTISPAARYLVVTFAVERVKVKHALHWTLVLQAAFRGKVRVAFQGQLLLGITRQGWTGHWFPRSSEHCKREMHVQVQNAGCRRIQMDAFCLRCVNGLLALHCSPLSTLSSPLRFVGHGWKARTALAQKEAWTKGRNAEKGIRQPQAAAGGVCQRRNEQEQERHEKVQEQQREQDDEYEEEEEEEEDQKKENKTHLFTKTPLIWHFFRHRKNEKNMWQKMVTVINVYYKLRDVRNVVSARTEPNMINTNNITLALSLWHCRCAKLYNNRRTQGSTQGWTQCSVRAHSQLNIPCLRVVVLSSLRSLSRDKPDMVIRTMKKS